DADGSYSVTKGITVTTVVPVVQLTGDSHVDEGSTYTINFSSTDAGGDSRDGWLLDWGAGDILFDAPHVATDSHTFADNGSYTVTATALASDGDSGSASIALTVDNVAPTVAITGTPSNTTPEGTAISFGSDVSDPGVNDTLTYGWTVYKDGS